jgi:hypothetical protein
VYRPLQFHERGQHFIGANDEPVSVAMHWFGFAMRLGDVIFTKFARAKIIAASI